MGIYEEWAIPLFELELFTHFEPMGVEYMMSNPVKDVGGQLDLIGYDTISKKQLTKLKLYQGENHPHELQKPKIINFENLNSKNIVK